VLDASGFKAHVVAKFLDGNGLVFFFVVGFFDFGNEVAAVSFTSLSDDLDVFGVNANAFHGFWFLTLFSFFYSFVDFAFWFVRLYSALIRL
jgi:hypothetical protein